MILQSIAVSIVATGLSVFGFMVNHEALSVGVFLLVPFCAGLSIAVMTRGKWSAAVTATTSLLMSLSILFFTGIEGIGCIIMAFPILFVSIGSGALVGYLFVKNSTSDDPGKIKIIVFCLVSMGFTGWAKSEPSQPESLSVSTSMNFYAPMDKVWKSVRELDSIDGDDRLLRFLGLPVPYGCEVFEDGRRICYFEEGEMFQKVTQDDYGKSLAVDIGDCTFEVRSWLTFKNARYEFIQHDRYVQVIRTDCIASTLRPRWYWQWFEEKCIQIQHRFVMSSMKRKAEHRHAIDGITSAGEIDSKIESEK